MRKILFFILIFLLLLGSVSSAASHSFSDTHDPAVEWLNEIMLMQGYPDGTFRPNKLVTRAELAVILSRLHAPELKVKVFGHQQSFQDLNSVPWAEEYINYMAMHGYLSGYPDGTFKPNQTVTWAEGITILMRMIDNLHDSKDWPRAYVEKANKLGLTLPTNINKPLSRGELAHLMYEWNQKDLKMSHSFYKYMTLKTIEQMTLEEKNTEIMKTLAVTDFVVKDSMSLTGVIDQPSLISKTVEGEYLFVVIDMKNQRIDYYKDDGQLALSFKFE